VAESSPEATCSAPTSYLTDDPALDALQGRFRPVLDVNRRSFDGRTGAVRGFGAGAIYPQIWLRDGATLIPATRYLESSASLTTWIEEHLAHQMPNGALWDWIAPGEPDVFAANAPRVTVAFREGGIVLSADKNTTAADQEASAVDAAFRVFRLTGDRGWLMTPVAGVALLDRLDAALSYVLAERTDPGTGLVASALTADWGDVSPAHPDQDAIYLDDHTPVAGGLYANVFFVHAAGALAEMHHSVGDVTRSEDWRQAAASLSERIETRLWDDARGFYRMHLVLEPRGVTFDDSDIFALGGNALAALYGIADDSRAARIFEAARARSRALGLSSAAGVLLPPYPTGFFAHPILREAYTYQNGGQWDWWSGRLQLAMFERGHSRAAFEELRAVAERVGRSGGLYEWYTPDGRGQGSDSYAGSLGSLAAAIFQGLFGIDSGVDRLDVTVRLGRAAGRVHVCEPAIGREVSYEYRYDAQAGRATLEIESNAPGSGRLAIRLPEAGMTATVLANGQPVPASQVRVGEDELVSWTTTWSPQTIELQLR